MRARRAGLVVTLVCSAVAAGAWQGPPSTSARVWEGRHGEFEEFLRKAPFQRFEDVPVGVTRPRRGFFDAGGLVASAAWKLLPPGRAQGYWESYKSEIAAYELDKLLQLGMVPPTVEKRWKGELGAAVLWLGPVRPWKEVEHQPKPERWSKQAVQMKMFDNLIANIDRNAGNLLVDGEWNLFLIDHSRAFITDQKLVSPMTRIDPVLWERMLSLDEATALPVLEKWIGRGAVRAMLKRRDRMKATVDALLKTGSASLVYVR